MNKLEIAMINNYCNAMLNLVNRINYGFKDGKYIAFFDINLIGWTIQVRENRIDGQKVWRMELNGDCDATDIENEIYEPTEENFILAIRKLRENLIGMQEEEVLDRVRTYR